MANEANGICIEVSNSSKKLSSEDKIGTIAATVDGTIEEVRTTKVEGREEKAMEVQIVEGNKKNEPYDPKDATKIADMEEKRRIEEVA